MAFFAPVYGHLSNSKLLIILNIILVFMKRFCSTIFIIILAASCFTSCALFIPKPQRDIKSTDYSIKFSSSDWESIPPDIADAAFAKRKTSSIITANSICKKYDSTSLENLTSSMISGLNNIKIEKEEELNFSERKARRVYLNGSLDGVNVSMIIQTLRKNRCVYDFVLISRDNKTRQADEKDYNKFLESVFIK
jgi:hypothetical protein